LNALKEIASSAQAIGQLCLQCGMCCNGVLFRDVELQAGDDADQLLALGMPMKAAKVNATRNVKRETRNQKFNQPCVALGEDCKCRIYTDRPTRCRQFECAVLLQVVAGEATTEEALKLIRSTRRKADKVLKLMREMGDTNEGVSLSVRFRKLRQKVEGGDLSKLAEDKSEDELFDLFGQLSMAVHELNFVLGEKFYPQ
jgi:Fe-S-cluster containining protein